MSGYVAITNGQRSVAHRRATGRTLSWRRSYRHRAVTVDLCCAVLAVTVALSVRFGADFTRNYLLFSLAFPLIWGLTLSLSGGYDVRFIGTGSDEFRKVLNAGISLTAALALFSYVINDELSRGYLLISMQR